ncbi:MAG TPA: putative quinol monooxygenase [Phycisphaerae bacterium]|jgi:autoinducer 2-degrading protein|nr:putative quinol monooxygenase [Phycisphaerae bacterium]
MYVVCVTILVKPEHVFEFIEATFDNCRHTRLEPENIRFDFSQAEDDPSRFFLYEVYREKSSFTTHQQTEHYQRWKNKVADWMREPRVGVKHHPLFFDDASVG